VNIDLISESAWIAVIEGTRSVQFEFLALQLLLVNLRNRLQAKELSPQDCIRELKTFYGKFSRLPMAENDFKKIANREEAPTNRLLDPAEIARKITAGQSLMLAGDEQLLAALPPGNWIGGTIPYFMAQEGGCLCKDKIFVTEIPGEFQASTQRYAATELPGLYRDAGERAVSLVILPAGSAAHTEFALNAPRYDGFALHPMAGWIAGIDLAMLGKAVPKVFCGGPEPLADAAVVMRMKLPANRLAQIKIINLFEPGNGDTIRFPASGLSTTHAFINGEKRNFAEYLEWTNADIRLPLVADYCGAMVNVSLRSVDPRKRHVEFYAPVVAGIDYRQAAPLKNYVARFEDSQKDISPDHVLFSCNCILNYLYSKLEGHRTSALVGPVTFGEIAFQLLNQTLVYVEIVKVASTDTVPDATTLELAAAHEEIQAGERRFRALTEAAPMGIFLTDANGRILYHNPLCRELSGVSTEDSTGDAWMDRIHPQDLPGVKAALEECARAHRNFEYEFRFIGPDGKTRWVHSQTDAVKSETGEITGRIGTVEDITERKQVEIELERLNQDLVRASREAGMAEVATGVLHNVKNVINSINVSAGVIEEQVRQSKSSSLLQVTALMRQHAGDLGSFITEDPRGKILPGYLEQLVEEVARERESVLRELAEFGKNVQHIKEVVRMQQDYAKSDNATETAKPVDLMEDALRIVAAGLARHGVKVVREYDANLPEMTVEKHKVLQILVNFIRNAKEACQASDRTDRKVVLRAALDGEFVRLAVTDNGIGIPPENISHLFEHGFTTKKDGHGYGLRSSARMAQELGGDIQAYSDGAGTGATFALKLPLIRPITV
jgi:PAS domain S-box-containing protein